jgi:hypothetical protein
MKGQEQVIGYAQRHGDRLVCHNYHHSLVVCHLVVRLLQLSIDVDGLFTSTHSDKVASSATHAMLDLNFYHASIDFALHSCTSNI